MKKLLSIIVPSYNMEAYLSKGLNSVLKLEDSSLLSSLEVIVVNDGSSDATINIAREFECRYPSVVRVIDKPNGNYGSCVNAALKIATGLYSKLLDADDSFETEGFERYLCSVAALVENGTFDDVDLVLCDGVRVDPNGKVIGKDVLYIKQKAVLGLTDIPKHHVYPNMNVAWRTDLLKRIGYHQTEGIMYTDGEWMIYPLVATRKLYYLPIVVYKYLIGREGQSTSQSVYRRSVSHMMRVYSRMLREANDEGVSVAAKYRLEYVAVAGIRGIYSRACRDCNLDVVKSRIREIDDIVKEQCAEYYDLFSFGLVKKWRTGCLSVVDLVLWRVRNMVFSIVVMLKKCVKFIARNVIWWCL